MSDTPTATPQGRRPTLLRNFTSFIGGAIVAAGLLGILVFILIDTAAHESNPYVGIFAFVVFPAVLVIGLLVVLIGALRERRRRLRAGEPDIAAYPKLDLNDPRRRRSLLVGMGLTLMFLFASAYGSYRAYEYTETTQFCGQLCHEVMHPEFIAYQNSPHARVGCVDCHVGPGAGWYLRSKLSGAYQVYAAAFNLYPKPIPTPVENLRPAQETCEQCHWPEKFFGAQLKVFNRFSYDEANTARHTRMLIRTGGGSADNGMVEGIHWHMNITNQVSYIAADPKRQVIPWVQIKDRSGKVQVYRLQGSKMTDEQIASSTKRIVDCVDCHNRPSHIYNPPDLSVDQSLFTGRVDPTLPYVKREAVALLSRPFNSTDQAMRTISTDLMKYYQANYPEVASSKKAQIERATAELKRIYRANFFPEMKVDFRTHNNNLGHYYYSGCFRCHDGKHVNDAGEAIRTDCNICHETLDQKEGAGMLPIVNGAYNHPLDFYGGLANHNCSDCHSGSGLSFSNFKHTADVEIEGMACADCHERTAPASPTADTAAAQASR